MWGEHHGHTSKLLVRKGQHVERGQVIALVGSTGNSTGPHDHVEVWKQDPAKRGYTSFPYGLNKTQVRQIYDDPTKYVGGGLPFSGYRTSQKFLNYASYPGGYVYHPGVDLAIKAGTQIKALHAGVVAYTGSNGGWGNHLYIKWDEKGTMRKISEIPQSEFYQKIDMAGGRWNGASASRKNPGDLKSAWIIQNGDVYENKLHSLMFNHPALKKERTDGYHAKMDLPKVEKKLAKCKANCDSSKCNDKLKKIDGIIHA